MDNSILDKNSALAARVVGYSNLVDKYTVIVPATEHQELELSSQAKVYGIGGRCRFFKILGIYSLAKRLLRQEKHDIITVQDPYFIGLVGFLLARKFGLGLEVQIHGWEKTNILRKIIAAIVLKAATAVRTISLRLEEQLIHEYGVDQRKITRVPVFVEFGEKPKKANKIKANNSFIFLTVSRLVPVKNINLQVGAFAEIVSQHPNIELWVVGDGPEKRNLESAIKKWGLENKIRLWGWKSKEELEEIYQEADCFLLTSDSEGWGMAVIEAAGYGLPIIMTDVGCAGEVIKDGESGLIIPVGDRKSLEVAMAQMIQDKDLRKLLGKGAGNSIKKLFSKEETLTLYLESWKKAL